MRPGTATETPDARRPAPPRLPAHRWLLVTGAVAAVQMIVVVSADGATRAGYNANRNWVSQLSLGPQGWIGVLNLSLCSGWLIAFAIGLRRWLVSSPSARWTVRLVAVCAAGFATIAVVPIDPGLGYPPGVPAVHTALGFVHQAGALMVFASGTMGAVLLGRCIGATRRGLIVAGVMVLSFIGATTLVILDVLNLLAGTPSGLLERVSLYIGISWIGFGGIDVLRRISR